MSATGDEAWKDREAAVLALGAVAEGCINGLYPHLSQVNHLQLFQFLFAEFISRVTYDFMPPLEIFTG